MKLKNGIKKHLDYIKIAANSGFNVENKIVSEVEGLKAVTTDIKGLKFIHVKCGLDEETPRPPLNEVKKSKF